MIISQIMKETNRLHELEYFEPKDPKWNVIGCEKKSILILI